MNKNKNLVAIFFILLLLILSACKKPKPEEVFKIPNLVNLNEQQITAKFNEMNIDVTLDFKEYYDEDLPANTFWQYENHNIGDVIVKDEVITIYLVQTEIRLPDFDEKNIDQVVQYFREIGIPANKIILQANSFSEFQNNTFIRYKDHSINDKHNFLDGPLTIIYKRNPTLPNLAGLNEQEIITVFQVLNLLVTLDFQPLYKENANGIFNSYVNNEVGDTINPGDIVSIYIDSNTINLPNLIGLNRTQIEQIFSTMGLPSTHYTFRGDVNLTLEKNEFIRYGNSLSAGTQATPTIANKLEIYYNISSQVPSLSGLNKSQITKALQDANIPVIKFEYTLDNTKEYDLFAGYGNYTAGQMMDPASEIIIDLYENNDVNYQDNIVLDKQLFISKYVDGNDSNKAIELFNPTTDVIDLSNYYLTVLSNGSFLPTQTILLNGTIEPNSTFVIVNNSAISELLDKADLTSDFLIFDGNDTIQLRKTSNNTYIDSIYHVGNISSTLNGEVFVRRDHITTGNRYFYQNDWFGFVPEYFDAVGTHPFNGNFRPGFDLIEDKTFQQYGMTKVKVLSVADGDTIYVLSLDPRDTTSYDGDSRLRFLMVDTPETEKPGVVGQPYANVATRFTRLMLDSSTEVYIQSDRSAGLTETYGRHLALIWFYIESDITFTELEDLNGDSPVIKAGWNLLNYELVRLGLGEKNSGKVGQYYNSPIFSNRYLYSWAESALLFAQENKLGLYSEIPKS